MVCNVGIKLKTFLLCNTIEIKYFLQDIPSFGDRGQIPKIRPEIIKLISCSTYLSLKFALLLVLKLLTIAPTSDQEVAGSNPAG